MRAHAAMACILLALLTTAARKGPEAEDRATAVAAIDFEVEVRPIFEKNCRPCHFKGGSMHERLPFDRGETIAKLGEKVFTRIKDEESRAVIRRFLASGAQGR